MKRTHFNQLLMGLAMLGLLSFAACAGDSGQDEAAIKAEVEQLESATQEMDNIKKEVESTKAELDAAMEEVDAILNDQN